jgi:DNA/RNA endonuclease YhcR with UshA esterase domain
MLALAMPGCIAAEQHRQQEMHETMVMLNRSQIMVITGDLPEPYQKLGEIKYGEPFSGAAIETDHINDKLRHLAVDQYQDRVDAIIRVANGTSDDGKIFTVTGQAVEVVGPCTFCRHKEVVVVDRPNPAQREIAAPKVQIGDTWMSRLNDTDGKIEVVSVSSSHVVVDWFGHRNTYTLEGNLISGHLGQLVGSFDPDLGTFNFPLWPGKKWSKDWLLKTDSGRIWGNTHGQALDWEQVTVPAGTLDALKLKIEYRTALFDVQMNCWYAPDVNAVAKCDTTDQDFKTQQLISYRPASANASR